MKALHGASEIHLCLVKENRVATTVNRSTSRLSGVDPAARSLELVLAAARTVDENRGRDIVVLDVRHLTQIFDYFVIATGTSRRHLHAISEEVDRKLEKEMGDRRLGREGYTDSRWILQDYGNLVIHLFDEETRRYFALEDLWAEGVRVAWEPSAPAAAR